MNTNLFKILIPSMLLLITNQSNAQTCSINSGVDNTICEAGVMTLQGNSTGAIATAAKWVLVSGPNVPTITSPSSAITTVTGFISGVYKFRYFAKCSDAVTVNDTVTITVDPKPIFSAGNDTFVCGNAATLSAKLPTGATGQWSSSIVSNVSLPVFSDRTSANSDVSITSGAACPQMLNVIWRVTKGACVLRDTATISFGGQTAFPTTPDQTICGTSFTPPTYPTGCGGALTATQLTGPTVSSIGYAYSSGSAATSANVIVTYSGLTVGTYTFATQMLGCSGAITRDTFVITVATTIAVTNPGVASKDLCYADFDSVYYFNPTVSLLPGETFTWNPVIASKTPSSLPDPTVTITGNTLKLTGVTLPDTFSTSGFYQYGYNYTVSNGMCTNTQTAYLTLRTPKKKVVFKSVVNQICNIDTAILTNLITGPPGLTYDQETVLLKPSGASTPAISNLGNQLVVDNLLPGRYTFSFRYTQGSCDFGTKIVDVYISKITGLSNAGTDQKLPCGTINTTLAGNTPVAGQVGTWQQVSGPSAATLTSPNNPSLPISGLVIGTYTFRWSIASGSNCLANVDNMNVIVAAATIANAGPDDTVCAGGAVTLNGGTLSFGDIGRWKQISGPTVTLSDSTTQYTTFTGAASDTFYKFVFSVRNLCDTSRDTITVTTSSIAGPSRAIINTSDTCVTASSSLSLVATSPGVGIGAWTQLSGPSTAVFSDTSTATTTVSSLVAGTYKFLWTISSAGCDDQIDTVRVSYLPTALILSANAGADQNVCGGPSITLGATAPSPSSIIGTWTQITGPGSVITSPNSPTSTVTSIVAGTAYDYVWTITAGAESVCPASKDTVHFIISTPPSAAVAMSDVTTCGAVAGSVAINATAPVSGTGYWSVLESPLGFSTTFANAASNSTTVNLTSGTTKILWQVSSSYGGACPVNYDTVTFERIPTVSAGANSSICNAATTSLSGSAFGTGSVTWTQVSGPTTITFNQPNSRNTTVSGLVNGVYEFKYTVTHPTCGGNANVTITNYGVPVAKAGTDNSVCWVAPSAALALNADTSGGINPATVTWSRSLGNGTVSYLPSATVASTTATVSTFGLHQFLLTVANPGCTSRDYIDVFVDKPTVLSFNLIPRSPCNDTFAVTAAVPIDGYTYFWEFPTGVIPSVSGINLRGPIANRFTTLGSNKVYLTLTNTATGCTAKDSFTIFVCKSVIPPIANNITAVPMNNSNEALAVPELKASNPSGTPILQYTVLTLPPTSQGILYYCTSATVPCPTADLSVVTTSTALTPTQAKSLYFDPSPNFTGNVSFTYNAIDTNDLLSNTATYIIPVFNLPPVTQNIRTAIMGNNNINFPIPSLIAADADGSIDSFIISSIPSSSIGVLKYCSNGTTPCTGTLISLTNTTTITKAQGLSLFLSPDSNYVGDYVFEYQSKDNNGNLSNPSSYTIPLLVYDYYTFYVAPATPVPPVADNITSQYINNSAGATPIPNLNGSDPDGTTVYYKIGSTVPNTTTQGTLLYCVTPGSGCILSPVTAGQTLTVAQGNTLQFDPVAGYIGTATFTYTSIDADASPKTSPVATYKIPVTNQPPVANPGSMTPISNSTTTYTLLPPLTGYDVDGTVVSYAITSVPPFSQGRLQYCINAPTLPCSPSNITAALSNLTAEQVATIQFLPNPTFVGDYVFNFTTTDNNGLVSPPALFRIPVIAFNLIVGAPPLAYSFNNPTIKSSDVATLTTALTGADPDGTVDSFIIRSITPANEGVLTYCTNPPATGCGTVLPVGLVMTPAQAATITFTPNTNFKGVSIFNYVNKDNDGNISNTATVSIPVVNDPPVSSNINNPAISRISGPVTLNSLASNDADGTIVNYTIETIPEAQQGVLRLCTSPPATGCVPVTVGQVISPADIGKLTFTPDTLNHSPTVTFLYSSLDNSGNISNIATVNIPFFNSFPLPIDLLSFEATKQGKDAILKWSTNATTNTQEFELQNSTDGTIWSIINSQKSKNVSGIIENFDYLHQNLNGKQFYRLKLIDKDRSYKYSPVKILIFDNNLDFTIAILPNPMTDKFTLSITNNGMLYNPSIYNAQGIKLQSFNKLVSGQEVDMSLYSSGFYYLKFFDDKGDSHSIKLIKK